MKDKILSNLSNSAQLERLYRDDKQGFKTAFSDLAGNPDLQNNMLVSFWKERLNFAREEVPNRVSPTLIFIIVASLIAGAIAKIPAIFGISEELFYQRNIGFILFPVLMIYFVWKKKLSSGKIAFVTICTIASLIFINSLPIAENSDTLVLSCIHLILFLWALTGVAYTGGKIKGSESRLSYLKYNGDLIIISGLILIAGGILTAVTIGLFELINIRIEQFYFDYVVVFALPAIPLVGTYLTQTNPNLVGRISPVISRIFSPIVLLMLVIYLIAIIYSGKDPYNNREFLLIFNALLIGVMGLIFFSVSEATNSKNKAEILILLLLSGVTVVVNCIALSAIVFRITEWGFTPNRVAVLGANLLILINLLMVIFGLYQVLVKKEETTAVEKAIAAYLPVYCIWAIIVTFLFPFIFNFQ